MVAGAAICATLGLGVLASCDEQAGSEGRRGPRGGGKSDWGRKGVVATPVKVVAAARQDLHSYLETYARLEPERRVTILARTTGQVVQLLVEEGDTVSTDQILLKLDPESAALRRRQARAEYGEARAHLERYSLLFEEKMVSRVDFETARLSHESAKVRLEEAEMDLGHTTIRAPMASIITRRLVELSDLVRANQEVAVVADLELLLARAFIPERRIYQVRPGQPATISVAGIPGATFAARIRMVSPEVIPENGTVKVTLEVPAGEGLRPGMFATVRLVTGSRPQALVIPKSALVLETEEDDVFAVVDSTVRRIPVELGLVEGGQVEVLAGVAEGDLLVTVGHDGLREGTLVRVVRDGQGGDVEASAADGPPAALGATP